jgi:hypothetical protein
MLEREIPARSFLVNPQSPFVSVNTPRYFITVSLLEEERLR